VFPLLSVLASGKATARGEDMLSGGVPCYAVYATADDRHLAVGALESRFWELFCRTLKRPDLAPHGLASGEDGLRIKAELAAIIAAKPLAHWAALFADVDCCVTPGLRLEETLRQEQIVARQMVIDVDGIGQFAPPWKISDYRYPTSRPAARAGADSEAILSAAGYSSAEIAVLRAAGVI
jgi:alpha-methylacyl-CoA racemase